MDHHNAGENILLWGLLPWDHVTASSLNRSKQRVQSAGFFCFFLSVTSSSDVNGPLTLAAVHVYRLRRMRRCYDVIRSDVYVRKTWNYGCFSGFPFTKVSFDWSLWPPCLNISACGRSCCTSLLQYCWSPPESKAKQHGKAIPPPPPPKSLVELETKWENIKHIAIRLMGKLCGGHQQRSPRTVILTLRSLLPLIIKTAFFGRRPETVWRGEELNSGLANFSFLAAPWLKSVELSCCQSRWGLSTTDYYSFWKIFLK